MLYWNNVALYNVRYGTMSDGAIGGLTVKLRREWQGLYRQKKGIDEPLFCVGEVMITDLRYRKGG